MSEILSRILYAVRTGDAHSARFWTSLLIHAAHCHRCVDGITGAL